VIAPGTIFSVTFAPAAAVAGNLDVIQGNNVVHLQGIPASSSTRVFNFSMPANYSGALPALTAPLAAGAAFIRATYGSAPYYSNWLPVTLGATISSTVPFLADFRANNGTAVPGAVITSAQAGQTIWMGVSGFNNENGSPTVAPHNRATFTVAGGVPQFVTPTDLQPASPVPANGGYYYFKVVIPPNLGVASVVFQTRLAITTDATSNLSTASNPLNLTVVQ
jgi:hypothetical protein